MLSDEEVDRLLARGSMTPEESQQALKGALRATAPPRWRRWTFGLAVPATAALLLLVFLPRSGFTPRGELAPPLLEVSCADGAHDRCRQGSLLLFHVASAQGGVLAAWADPVDGKGERVWYFPTAGGEWAPVPASPELQTLGKAARLGAEQPPGVYQIHLVLASHELSREELAAPNAGGVLGRADARLEVTP
jgi:hypothetical protein